MTSTILLLLFAALWFFLMFRSRWTLGACAGHGTHGGHHQAGAEKPGEDSLWLWACLLCILPLLLFLGLIVAGGRVSPLLFWLFLAFCFLLVYLYMQRSPAAAGEVTEEAPPPARPGAPLEGLISRAGSVFEARAVQPVGDGAIVEGRLLTGAEAAFKALRQLFAGSGYTPLLQEGEGGRPVLVVSPGAAGAPEGERRFPWTNLVLLLLTFLTTTWAGAVHRGIDVWSDPRRLAAGLPYALALLVILGAHELGHYFAARAHGVEVTLPYFIPVPFGLGTFGAFIRMKSVPESRRALFDVAVAGPLAGLVLAVPALWIGLSRSQVVAVPGAEAGMHGGTEIGSSVLLALVSKLALGRELAFGHQLQLDPLAFAGWLGLMVTALNLLPIGQLDGGHIAHALFGRRANAVGSAALLGLLLLGLFVWSGFLTWALIVFFLTGSKTAPPQEDLTPVSGGRAALGALAYALLFLILAPVPQALYQALGLHSPYL